MSGFQIPHVTPTVYRSICFPSDVVAEVERMIKGESCTFSAFVIAAVRHALDQLRQEKQGEDNTVP